MINYLKLEELRCFMKTSSTFPDTNKKLRSLPPLLLLANAKHILGHLGLLKST